MKHLTSPLCHRALALLVAGGLSVPVLAGPGHDHGDEAPVATGTAAPRVSAHSDLFELVGIVEHETMTLYLDRHASNEPVRGARIEVEAGEAKGLATEQEDGSYAFRHAAFEKEGRLSVTFTVAAGQDTDLLAGDIEIGQHDGEAPAAANAAPGKARLLAYAGAGLAVLVALVFTIQRLRRRPVAR